MKATADQIIRGLEHSLNKQKEENKRLRQELAKAKWSGYRAHQQAALKGPGGTTYESTNNER